MQRETLALALLRGRILVGDGAWGTELYRRGLAPGECPELWCQERPAELRAVAAGYLEAGAETVGTNSFGGNRLRLAAYGLARRASELNEAAARISREAAESAASIVGNRRAWVLASMGPSGLSLARGEVAEAELYAAFAEQALSLAKGGAEALSLETMMDAAEAAIAIRAAKAATGLEILCSYTFARSTQGELRTLAGQSLEAAATAALEAGADIVGVNCGSGLSGMAEAVRELRRACPDRPVAARPSAGLPVASAQGPSSAAGGFCYPEGPAAFAALLPALLEAGAGLVGGCCGTTVSHIAALRRAVDGRGLGRLP